MVASHGMYIYLLTNNNNLHSGSICYDALVELETHSYIVLVCLRIYILNPSIISQAFLVCFRSLAEFADVHTVTGSRPALMAVLPPFQGTHGARH